MLLAAPLSAAADQIDILLGHQNAAWQMACEAKQIDCTLVELPRVAFTLMPPGALGMYPNGGGTVFVNIRYLYYSESVSVMLHEMVHYLQQVQIVNVPGFHMTWCEREAEAFTLTLAMSNKYHLDTDAGGTVPWSRIALQYGCTNAAR